MLGCEEVRKLAQVTPSKIVLLVLDGLGGLPDPETGKTELETAKTPNLDSLAAAGICGMQHTVSPGITPGSAPGHLALFGYDPIECQLGRGIVEALGLDIEVGKGDVVARGNFCTVDDNGRITDRRAGRIPGELNHELCDLLNKKVQLPGVEVSFYSGKEHRFVIRLRGEDLSQEVADTDPQHEGMKALPAKAFEPAGQRTAELIDSLVEQAHDLLKDKHPANMVLLRGFSKHPDYPSMDYIYRLTPACIATYPMYRGVARVVGMSILPAGETLDDQLAAMKKNYDSHDFFFLHYKKPDARGEDGDFDAKVEAIEAFDEFLPSVLELKPDVVIITGDHSTPASLAQHSWHPLPVILTGRYCRPDTVREFSESACLSGGLGHIHAMELMPLAMANALKLNKFGA
ncbi:MAG: 2,3-bisphosphoglycerate-independent phosphoglycerate mutase [Chloroflexota bacterium]